MNETSKEKNTKDPSQQGQATKRKTDPSGGQQATDSTDKLAGSGSSPPTSATGDSSAVKQRAKSVTNAGRRLSNAVNPDQQEEMRRARNELRFDGSLMGGVFDGDHYGDYNYTVNSYKVFPGRDNTEFRTYRVLPEELEQPFVPPPGFDEVAKTVRNHRLVAIRGKAGIGKTSALLQALTQILPDGAPVMRLEPRTDFTTLSCEKLPDGAVLVLDDLSGRDAAQLDSFTLERLAAELEQHQRRIAITVGVDVALRPTLRLAVAELSAGPAPRQVFNKHFAELLASAPTARAQLLDDVEVQKLLEEQLTGSVTLDQAARLAKALAHAKDNPANAAASARDRIRKHLYDECVQWFRDLPGLREHCIAIALAVLNGLPSEVVSSAADRLEKLIEPPPDQIARAPVADLFAPKASVPLSLLRAETASEVTSTGKDAVPGVVLRFVHNDYPRWVLQHVWGDYDKARSGVVTWLGDLGRHGNWNVRVRAATAVGELALVAFDFLRAHVIAAWAQDADWYVRDSAAMALKSPASDARFQDAVRAVVQDWEAEGGLFRATAARTYGESAGLARPTNSLRQLARLAEVEDIVEDSDTVVAVAISLSEMVEYGTVALVGRVLAEVDSWTRQANRERRFAGRLAFLRMTFLRGVPTALREIPETNKFLPTLLLLAISRPGLLDQLARLWADGVNSAELHTLFLDSLSDWAAAVEPHPEARAVFVALMRASAHDRRTGVILARAATSWGSGSKFAPKTAESLLGNATGVSVYG